MIGDISAPSAPPRDIDDEGKAARVERPGGEREGLYDIERPERLPNGNRVHGDVVALDTRNALLWSDGIPIGVIGLDEVVVVAAHGAVLVAAKSQVQRVRAIAGEFAARRERSDATKARS